MESESPPAFRRRIAIGFAAAALLIVLIGLVSLYALHVAVSSDRALFRQARDVIEFGRLRAANEIKMVSLRGLLITGDENFLFELARSRRELLAEIARLRATGPSAREAALLSAIERSEERHQSAAEEAIALRRSGAGSAAIARFFAARVEPAREALERSLAAYLYEENRQLAQTDRWSSGRNRLASILIIVIGLLALGLTAALSVTLTRRLARLYETERDQRRAAEAARQRYSDLVDGIPGGFVWEADATTLRMTFVSSRAESMLGYPRQESLGDPGFWTRLIHPEDRERVLAAIARTLSEGTGQSSEHRCLTADGRTVWLQSRVRLVRKDESRPARLRGLSVDITRLKQADESLRAQARAVAESEARKAAVLNSALDAVVTIDAQGRILEFNPSAERIFGYAAADAIGREMAELIIPHRLREKHRNGLAATVRTGEGAILNRRLEMPALRSDGTEFSVELTIARISGTGPPVFTGFVRDITERQRLEKERADLLREAREAIRARDEFLSIASHELKTPLTTLRLQVQGVVRKIQTAGDVSGLQKVVPRLATAERQIERLTSLINSLLDISRITAGRLDLDREPVDLAALVREVAARHREELTQAECRLELACDGPSTGHWDRLRVEQIVVNLLSNAIKYGAGHPIEVDVGGDVATARLLIRDHGIGIPAEDQSRIFERFERAVSDRHYGGLGLGLWIVRQVVDALGGRIAVESLQGAGSTFIVELPRAAPPGDAGEHA